MNHFQRVVGREGFFPGEQFVQGCTQRGEIGVELGGKGTQVQQVVASADELRKRGKEILQEIKALEARPRQSQVLRYHTPVSRAVHADEMFFECRHGRVTFIDLPRFKQEITVGRKAGTVRSKRFSSNGAGRG